MNLLQLLKISSLFCIAALDRFDWVREGLLSLKQKAEDKSIFNRIDQILSEQIEAEWEGHSREEEKAGEYGLKLSQKHDNIKHELTEILKYFMRIKDYDSSNQIRNMLRLLTESSRKFERRLQYTPRREFAQPEKYLYHGTNAADAFSIIKDKTVIKGSAFTNLSLTVDITSAAKFGDVILVFDAKKLQRSGAKKMRYYPEKTYLKQFELGRESESSEGSPFISDIYKYEQEWSVKLPFKFKDGDLVKIIVLKDKVIEPDERIIKRAPKERIKQILETISNVPVEIQYLPSYSHRSIEETKEEDIEKGPLRNVVYKKILEPISEIKDIGGNIVREEIQKIKEKYPKHIDSEYLIKNNSVINSINYIYGNIWQPFSHGVSNWDGLLDLNKVMDAIDIAKRALEDKDFRYSRIVAFGPALAKIRDSREEVLEAFKQANLKDDNDYANAILRYNSSYYRDLKPDLIKWIDNNPWKFKKLVLDNEHYKRAKELQQSSSVEELVRNITHVENLPDEYWRENPVNLLDHQNFGRMPTERVRKIFKNNPEWHYIINNKFSKEDTLRGGWRSERILDENKNNFNEVVKIADEENVVQLPEEKIAFKTIAYKIMKISNGVK